MAPRRYFDAAYLVSGSLSIFHPSRSWPYSFAFESGRRTWEQGVRWQHLEYQLQV